MRFHPFFGILQTVAVFELLEPRRLYAVNFTINAGQDVHSISRFIYGVNESLGGAYSNATLERLGGNRWTAYNWENNASNAGSDYIYQNDGFLGGGNTPGGAVMPALANAAAHNAGAILTIPINGYVSADKNNDGDVHYFNNNPNTPNPNYLATRFNPETAAKGSAFSLTPSLTDGKVYQDEFVNWVKTNYAYGQTDASKPIWFDLDNEPDLWQSTHAEVHPASVTYAEMIQKTVAYASAIKNVEPGAMVFGPVNYGWEGYINLQNAPDANGRDFQSYYLQQLAQASTAAGKRLVDALDVHWYPEATGTNGVRITSSDASAATVAARLQAPRSLWDSTYTESSWITQYSTLGPINLIPRLNAKIAANNPGTKLAITEYNYGGGGDISGGIAEADVLGIYGRDSVFAANEWHLNSDESYIGGAFQMFRNYDNAGGAFGDISIHAGTSDVPNSSVYASLSSTDPNTMTIIAINKTGASLPANINIAGKAVGGAASVYKLASGNSAPVSAGTLSLNNGQGVYTMPAYSVSTIRVPIVAAPAATSTSFNYLTNPNSVQFTFNKDVSGSLSSGDVTVTNTATQAPVAATYAGYDAATNAATFNLQTPLPDGSYQAVLAATGVSDSAGNPLAANATASFFSLGGDANHDASVNVADLGILASNWQQSGRTFAQGDFNYDGTVDIADLGILASHWQNSVSFASRPLAPAGSVAARAATHNLLKDLLD